MEKKYKANLQSKKRKHRACDDEDDDEVDDWIGEVQANENLDIRSDNWVSMVYIMVDHNDRLVILCYPRAS